MFFFSIWSRGVLDGSQWAAPLSHVHIQTKSPLEPGGTHFEVEAFPQEVCCIQGGGSNPDLLSLRQALFHLTSTSFGTLKLNLVLEAQIYYIDWR